MTDARQGAFGVYVHWPFCQSKCPYCDFNSHVAAHVDQRQWARAFLSELGRYHAETAGRAVESLFFGGGTPSLMQPELVETIVGCIAERWGFAKGAEITLEANPSSVEAGRFRDYRSAGINRVSLGIQSLDDRELKRLGRLHSASEALAAIETAQETFARVSIDLIYARQDQRLADWQSELNRALSLGTEHLSAYQLTIENGTAFGRLHAAGKLPGLPTDDLAADMYSLTQEICASHGLLPYEVSNHARPLAESRHNLIYWRGGDYLGIGPGAHGRITLAGQRHATSTLLDPRDWLAKALSGNGEQAREAIEPRDQALEYLMMSLRLTEGSNYSRLLALDNTLIRHDKLSDMVELGHLELADGMLRATATGRILLNAIIREIVND